MLILGLGAVAALVAIRFYILPRIDEYREPIVASIAQAIGQTVEIGRIEGNWRDFRPELRLIDVQVHEAGGLQTLAFDRVDTALSWRSLIARNIVFKRIEFAGPDLELRRDSLGTLWVAGAAIARGEPGSRLKLAEWLIRQGQIVVRDARITWIDEMRSVPALIINDVTMRMENNGSSHEFGVTGRPPAELASAITVSGNLSGERFRDIASWRGSVFGEFEYANLALARQWVTFPVQFDSGLGVLRVWMDVAHSKVSQVTAEAELVSVEGRLAPELQPFALANLSGRVQWDEDETGETIALSQLTLRTEAGVELAPVSVTVRKPVSQGSPTELVINSLELGPLAALSKSLPLNPEVVDKVAMYAPRGVVEELRANWVTLDGAKPAYALDARFRELGVNAVDKLPGFSGMSGTVSVSATGGTVSLQTQNALLQLPGVLAEPINFEYLDGDAEWNIDDAGISVTVRNVSFTNEHAAGKAQGSYYYSGKDKGDIDLRAVLVRADARYVWRYFPHFFPKVQAWLKQGLVTGRTDDVRLRLAGPLHKFPFPARDDGIFEIRAAVRDASVRIKQGWPLIEDVAGDFLVRQDRIDIEPRSGTIMGANVAESRVSIMRLGSKLEHVVVNGMVSASVSQLLGFVANSPVAGYTRQSTANMRGQGGGVLDLAIDLPLRDPGEISVDGRLELSGPNFSVSPRLPDLGDYAVRVDFSEDRVMLRKGRAKMLGGGLRFSSQDSRKGTMVIDLAGWIVANNLAAFYDDALLRRLDGKADWKGQLVFNRNGSHMHAESSLVGMGSRLPSPMDKLAPTALPIKVDVRTRRGESENFAFDIAKVGNARWAVQDGVISSGAIELGAATSLPAERRGISVGGQIGFLDVDGWRDVMREGTSGESRLGPNKLDTVNLEIGKLVFAGRSFRDVQIQGERDAANWKIALSGPQIEGSMSVSPDANGSNRVNARFASLAIPPPDVSITATATAADFRGGRTRQLPPALNVVVDGFRFEGRPLGRLELLAEPDEDRWELARLAISNPDGRIDMKGFWNMVGRAHTKYVVRIEASDIGKFFKRLGYAETVVGGSGTLTGPVSWLGGPFQPNLPTLTGKLTLQAVDGRFAQVDPGAAQLIGILSLQAIPRRLTFDFKDVFYAGFSFDRIAAEVSLQEGVAKTEDFRMAGVAAEVTMRGEVNLAAETQNLDIHVRPQLSGATAVAAGAAVVSPLVGVAALLVQKALGDPVEQAASRDYRVTGTWGNPHVERIKREVERPKGARAPAGGR